MTSKPPRTYDVYFVDKNNKPAKWEIYGNTAFNARCVVEELNPGCKIRRVLLQDNSDW
jgi:hypothetical protein